MAKKVSQVLIFSDTHGYLEDIPYLRYTTDYDYFIYLGDGYEEVEKWSERNKLGERFIAVTGNCDYAPKVSRQRIVEIGQIKIFLTHGDLYSVKSGYELIFQKAKKEGVDIALFGHTHYADHHLIEGIHLFNPGSILPRGRDFASVGYLEIEEKKILTFEHLKF